VPELVDPQALRRPVLRVRRLGIDTYREPVVYMRADCAVCRSEGFEAQARVIVRGVRGAVLATLNVLHAELIGPGEIGLSEAAFGMLGAEVGELVELAHPRPLDSMSDVRRKVYGGRLDAPALERIVADVAAGRYTDVEIAALVTACAGTSLDQAEISGLTRAMIDVGESLRWDVKPVLDKHSVGGLPGNRTTPIVVAIIAACGLTIPKTSSRAITSAAGTADVMETLAPVDLDLVALRRVVEREGGCIVWGGAVRLSPADDLMIRVERALDLDSDGQMVASVLSKKAAAGSTHVVIDMPVGPTAKVRDRAAAARLHGHLVAVGRDVGLQVRVVETDGAQPVGRRIGPALEARDVLAVLGREPGAPADLRQRALLLSGALLECAGRAAAGQGEVLAREVLESGRAHEKFLAICEAQGGARKPPVAVHVHTVEASRGGVVTELDNRRLARLAKLAGAPRARAAGIELHVSLASRIEPGQPLLTIHAEAPGELAYALDYLRASEAVIRIEEGV
jgi:thymidine phosphorylase